jgi:predicted nucleic acid-binding protein
LPVLDTEVLFALSPKDARHGQALRLLRSRRDLLAADTSLLEFQLVLRARGLPARSVARAVVDVGMALDQLGVGSAKTVDVQLVARQCELEERHGLTFFDSLIAASALSVDQSIVSDDEEFDLVEGLTRIPIG